MREDPLARRVPQERGPKDPHEKRSSEQLSRSASPGCPPRNRSNSVPISTPAHRPFWLLSPDLLYEASPFASFRDGLSSPPSHSPPAKEVSFADSVLSDGAAARHSTPAGARGGPARLGGPFQDSFVNKSFNPMCRICHEDSSGGVLLSPCHCSGSVGLVHKACLETWLSGSNSATCEICHKHFELRKRPKPFFKYFTGNGSPEAKRAALGDLICFLILTPLTAISTYLCILGALQHALDSDGLGEEETLIGRRNGTGRAHFNSSLLPRDFPFDELESLPRTRKPLVDVNYPAKFQEMEAGAAAPDQTADIHLKYLMEDTISKAQRRWEASGLVLLAAILASIYLTWVCVAFRYHYTAYRRWRSVNFDISLVDEFNNETNLEVSDSLV